VLSFSFLEDQNEAFQQYFMPCNPKKKSPLLSHLGTTQHASFSLRFSHQENAL
jgi:hypothetical protein